MPKAIKSLNVTQGGKTWRTRHHKNKADRLDWERLLKSEFVRAVRKYGTPLRPNAFATRVRITRVWGKGERAFDVDNLIGGCKSLVDAMKVWLIIDDSPGKCNIVYKQVKGPLIILATVGLSDVEGGNTIIELSYN